MNRIKFSSIISFLIVVLFFGTAAVCNQCGITPGNENAAIETAEEYEAPGKFDENLTGTWVSDCLVPDTDSPWSEKHQFVIKSDGSAIHTRWSSSGHECVVGETLTSNYKLSIPSTGQIDIKDIDLNQIFYDIYKISDNTLLFGHGFRGDNTGMQIKDGNFGSTPETRFTTLNKFIVYKK